MNRFLWVMFFLVLIGCQKDPGQPENLKRWALWVYEGDSITDLTANPENYPFKLTNDYSYIAAAKQVNVAQSGDLINSMVGEYITQVHPFRRASRDSSLFILLAGTNDAAHGRSSNQIYTDLKAEWANARNDGFKVVALCMLRSNKSYIDTVGIAVDQLIASDPSQYDYLVRTNKLLPNANNTLYFLDGVHPTPKGSSMIANAIVQVLSQ